jgi:hypothetical protein
MNLQYQMKALRVIVTPFLFPPPSSYICTSQHWERISCPDRMYTAHVSNRSC